ncbi:MAG: hypothetical protein RIS22_504 [Actinomycetota bacterium]
MKLTQRVGFRFAEYQATKLKRVRLLNDVGFTIVCYY